MPQEQHGNLDQTHVVRGPAHCGGKREIQKSVSQVSFEMNQACAKQDVIIWPHSQIVFILLFYFFSKSMEILKEKDIAVNVPELDLRLVIGALK